MPVRSTATEPPIGARLLQQGPMTRRTNRQLHSHSALPTRLLQTRCKRALHVIGPDQASRKTRRPPGMGRSSRRASCTGTPWDGLCRTYKAEVAGSSPAAPTRIGWLEVVSLALRVEVDREVRLRSVCDRDLCEASEGRRDLRLARGGVRRFEHASPGQCAGQRHPPRRVRGSPLQRSRGRWHRCT